MEKISISGSVGLRGRNNPIDVLKVQRRLNALMPPQRFRLKENGQVGMATKDAIREFQLLVVGYVWPDKRVDTNDRTIRMLNDPNSKRIWANDPQATRAIALDRQVVCAIERIRNSTPSENCNDFTVQELNELRREIGRLERAVQRAYPDGRPTGAGIYAIMTPGKATAGGFEQATVAFDWGKQNFGAAGEITGAILMAPASLFIVVYGGVLDTTAAVGQLAVGDPQHGSPTDYDQQVKKIRTLREKFEKGRSSL
ncbi:hypothetical protein [Thalassoglobus neptunius]|nr:hypothetical protein [Thalassoglobus neptunius]